MKRSIVALTALLVLAGVGQLQASILVEELPSIFPDGDPLDTQIVAFGNSPVLILNTGTIDIPPGDTVNFHVGPFVKLKDVHFVVGGDQDFIVIQNVFDNPPIYDGQTADIVGPPFYSESYRFSVTNNLTDPDATATMTATGDVIPEPSTFAIWGLGLLGYGWRRRKLSRR